MDLPQIKNRLHQLLGREVDVQKTRHGKYACEYFDAQIATSPASLVADTELEACQKLLTYLESRPPQPAENVVEDEAEPV